MSEKEIPNKQELLTDKKRLLMETLGLKEEPDIILCLDAGIAERRIKDPETQTSEIKWVPTSYRDESANFPNEGSTLQKTYTYGAHLTEQGFSMFGSMGGKAKVVATAELYKYFKKPVIVDSRVETIAPPEIAQPPADHWPYYQQALEERGVATENIIAEKDSTSTFEELIKAIEIISARKMTKIILIANEFHMPRLKKMYQYLTDPAEASDKLKYILAKLPKEYQQIMGCRVEGSLGQPKIFFQNHSFFRQAGEISIDFVVAEEVLKFKNPHYTALLAQAQKNDYYQKRMALEENGIRQLEQGIYGKPNK